MEKPLFMSKLTFQDFPDSFVIKTYLGSRVLIVMSYEIYTVVLREDNVILKLSTVDLQASKEEIIEKRNKVYNFCEDFNNKNKPKKAKKAKVVGIPVELGRDRADYGMPLLQFSHETLHEMARDIERCLEHDFNE